MDRDIVLSIELEKEHAPSVELVKDADGDQFVAVSFVPEFEIDELTEPKPSETVFVLDCSGSMQGESIAQATLALELCLRALNPNDHFNICRFGSTFEMMSSEPLKYSSETLARAIQYIHHGADLGGTELLGPLQAIFAAKPQAAVRNVVLLTDGQVSNEPAVIELARKFRTNHRIFSFGIGSACSAYLVKGLARATGGAAEFISGNERIEEKVLRMFSRIASPMLTDVHIDWGGAEVQTLAEIPPVFDGEVMTIFGKVAGSRLPKQISLRGDLRGTTKLWEVEVPSVRDDAHRLVPTLWARRMIQSIEEVNNIFRSAVRSNETRERKLLIELSKQYSVLCALTTFVAIEHRNVEERNDGKPELRRVPVQLAHGWGGMHAPAGAAGGVAMACMAPAPMSLSRMAKASLGGNIGRTIDRLRDALTQRSRAASPPADVARFVERIEPRKHSELSHLLCLQQAEGYFKPDKVIDHLFRDSGFTWKDEWVNNRHPIDPRVKATVMALKVLRSHFASDESLWKRAAAKAEKWLAVELHISAKQMQELLA
jgi:Ca-activated chloride channel family protein